jgi:predicted nuclease of restriction endonuclease-like (RecB) superfamily
MSKSDFLIPHNVPDPQETGQVLFRQICQIIDTAKQRAAAAINEEMIHLNNQQQQLSPKFSLKDPDILDFIGLSDYYPGTNFKDIILRDIEKFLLKMGAGFTFVAR